MKRGSKISTYFGVAVLVIISGFHLSGTNYMFSLIDNSDLKPFLKEIFHLLFVHPSIHLVLLGLLGLLSLIWENNPGKYNSSLACALLLML